MARRAISPTTKADKARAERDLAGLCPGPAGGAGRSSSGVSVPGPSVSASWYLANFANYDATYGSLGAAIGMMIWMRMSSIVILLGGEFNSEVERQTARNSTTGHERPIGERGAAMATGWTIKLNDAKAVRSFTPRPLDQ